MSVRLRSTVKAKNGSFSYVLDISHKGQRWKETLFRVSKHDNLKEKELKAQKMRILRQSEIDAGLYGETPMFKKNINILSYFDTRIEEYQKKDGRVIKAAISQFRKFLKLKKISEHLTFQMLTERIVNDFMIYLNYQANLSGVTPSNYFKKFKMLLKEAKRDKILDPSVYQDVNFKSRGDTAERSLKKNVLTQEEIEILWLTPCGNQEIKKAFLFGCYTGLTFQEIFRLKWHQIDAGVVTTERVKTLIPIKNVISPRMLSALGETGLPEDSVFNLRNKSTGRYLTINNINAIIKRWCKSAGILKHITSYSCRHTFAVRLLQNRTNLKTVADAMGHRNINTTTRYLNHVNDLKDQATQSLL